MSTNDQREAMQSATRGLPPVRLGEIVLRTARYQELKDWYQAVLGVDPYLDTDEFCFRRLHMHYPYSQVLAIFHVPDAVSATGPVAGLDHMQLRHESLEAMFDRFERLKTVGIVPSTSMNHGPGTSFYYRDPDQNSVELFGPNFDDERAYLAYFASDSYRNNIAGILVDPDDFVQRFRSGTSQSELIKF